MNANELVHEVRGKKSGVREEQCVVRSSWFIGFVGFVGFIEFVVFVGFIEFVGFVW